MESPRSNKSPEKVKDERRGSNRFPIEQELRFKVLSRKSSVDSETGTGITVNISRKGILFTADRNLSPGRNVELSINWPARLNNTISLRLVVRGRVIRSDEHRAAIEINRYEFRTQTNKSSRRK